MKVLFLGSSRFSKFVLQQLLDGGVNITAVITQPDKPSGRGHKMTPTEVKVMAQEKGIEVFTFDRMRNYQDQISAIDFDISVVASYGQILPQWFLDLRPCINVHPSLLPKYRGASPLQSAILNGDKETGVTIMKVAMEVDAGDIILQQKVSLDGEYYLELEEKLGNLGGQMACEAIDFYKSVEVTFTEQDHSKAVHVSKFEKEDGLLDFLKSSTEIINRVRALSETIGCYFYVDDMIVKVVRAEEYQGECQAGTILENKKRFVVGTNGGAVEILQCKAPSGKTVCGQDFINGHNEILGKKVN